MAAPDLVQVACEEQGAIEPLEFLAALVAGVDPRDRSDILKLVDTIEEENFGDPPDPDQWEQLVNLVRRQYKHTPVPVTTSSAAARTLAEYQHAKRKSIELLTQGAAAQVTDLTPEELELFEAWFNDQF